MRFSRTRRKALTAVAVLGSVGALALVAAGAATGSSSSSSKLTALGLANPNVDTIVGAKTEAGRAAQTDPSLLGRTDSTRVNVMLKYDYDATASYAGGIKGLAATSPRATGKALKNNRGAVAAYDAYTKSLTQKIDAAAQAEAPGLDIRRSFQTAYGGVEASVPANQINSLLKAPGVVAVQKDSLAKPQDDFTTFIGAQHVWPSLGGSTTAGDNVVVGLLDTGVWPESPFFQDHGLPAPPGNYACQFGDGTDSEHLGPAFQCNNKLIGAYAFTQTYMAVRGSDGHEFCNDHTGECSARDSEGHGTHTASIAAGDCVSSAVLYGVDHGPVCGVAPGAHVIEYRVCLSQGCFLSDSVAAVAQAITDGVNVISFSIGGGSSPYTDPVELAFLDAVNAGISVNAAAGNSGPGSEPESPVEHAGPWVTTVGASTGPRSFASTLHLTADGGATLHVPGVTITNGITTPTPVVMADTLPGEDAECKSTLTPGTAAGMVVVCKRSASAALGNARIAKGFNVFSGGAAGMILYNLSAGQTDLETDNHWLPAIQTQFESNAIADFVTTHTNVTATWAQGVPTPSTPDVMAAFSSRGPSGDWIKPDVTAPGIQVVGGMTPQPDETDAGGQNGNGPPGNLFQVIAGTSMSTPHGAGVSALVKAAHPDWTPEEIKSALMTSSVQDVLKEDGTTPATPFDDGAGSIRADRAVNPTLVFNETYADFVAAASDPLHRIDLNLASIDAPTMSGQITTTRTVINVSGQAQTLDVSTVAPQGASIIVNTVKPATGPGGRPGPGPGGLKSANTLQVGAGAMLTFTVTISAPNLRDGQYLGQITLTPQKGATPVVMPVVFDKQQGSLQLTHTCEPTTFASGTGVGHCTAQVTNLASTPANTTLNITSSDKGNLRYSNISPPARAIASGGVTWSGQLQASLPPDVQSIGPGGTGFGYIPLSDFAGSVVVPAGDDTLNNVNVDPFTYGHETYDQIGIGSNGFVVVGGDHNSADATPAFQTFPDPSTPNNVIAPFWTDLNPSAHGQVLVDELTDGTNVWIVVDWEDVPTFDDGAAGPFSSFEVWIQTAATGEGISLEYGTLQPGDPDVGGSGSGAENRDGTSGVNFTPASGGEYTVTLGSPQPGGHATVTYDVSAARPGAYTTLASAQSDVTNGVAQVPVQLTVTQRAKP